MGRHQAKIVDKQQLGDGSIAIRLSCCGPEEHDQWHTHYDIGKKNADEVTAWAKDCLAKRESHCEAMRTAHRAIDVLTGSGL